MDEVFAPPGGQWHRVSPKLMALRRTVLMIVVGVTGVVAGTVLGLLLGWWAVGVVAALAVVALGWGLWLIPRNWQAWGYTERLDDLIITHGVMFRRLIVVPYGRMQFVDVKSGPVERRYGLATVQLHTASPATDARIPGLPEAEAARLRDRLSALGEAQAAGL